jgi:hypothetical protein
MIPRDGRVPPAVRADASARHETAPGRRGALSSYPIGRGEDRVTSTLRRSRMIAPGEGA